MQGTPGIGCPGGEIDLFVKPGDLLHQIEINLFVTAGDLFVCYARRFVPPEEIQENEVRR